MRACAALLRDGLASEKLPFRGKAQKPRLLCFTTNELLKESVSSARMRARIPRDIFRIAARMEADTRDLIFGI